MTKHVELMIEMTTRLHVEMKIINIIVNTYIRSCHAGSLSPNTIYMQDNTIPTVLRAKYVVIQTHHIFLFFLHFLRTYSQVCLRDVRTKLDSSRELDLRTIP